MNERLKSIIYRLSAIFKLSVYNLRKNIHILISKNSMVAPSAEVIISKSSTVSIGKDFALLKRASLICRNKAKISVGNKVSIGIGSYINIHDALSIGDNVHMGQDVKIYDHDHDFKNYPLSGTEWYNNYTTSPVTIGSNVWIGANVVILKGTVIGDNSVIAAGCILKGITPPHSVVIQHREKTYIPIT